MFEGTVKCLLRVDEIRADLLGGCWHLLPD
jgi:hypothetical protein